MTTRLFLHSPSEAPDAPIIAGRMPEFERYGERALLLAGPRDVVCVARAVDEGYLDFLDALEIGPHRANIVVVEGVRPGTGLSSRVVHDPDSMDRVVARLAGHGPIVVSPFFPTADAFALGRALEERLARAVRVEGGSAGLVRRLHDKVASRALALSLGIPVAPGEVVRIHPEPDGRASNTAALRDAILRWSGVTGQVIARGASGASGSSIFTSRSGIDAMLEAIAERTDNVLYLVEPLFEARSSPNVEVLVEPGLPPPGRVGVSEQILDANLVYAGSALPSRALRVPRMVDDALAIVAWMRERRFTGRVGFDFVEHAGSGEDPDHFLTEINPRINGASYPLALLRRLAGLADRRGAPAPTAFRTGYLPVRTREFGELAELARTLLYDPRRGQGIVPYSVGALPHGKVGIACLGLAPEVVEDLLRDFQRLAGVLPDRSTSARVVASAQ